MHLRPDVQAIDDLLWRQVLRDRLGHSNLEVAQQSTAALADSDGLQSFSSYQLSGVLLRSIRFKLVVLQGLAWQRSLQQHSCAVAQLSVVHSKCNTSCK